MKKSNKSLLFFRILGAVFFISPFSSCASLGPLFLGGKDADNPYPPLYRVPTITDLRPHWEAVYPGLEMYSVRVDTPALEVWALRIHLDNPAVRAVVGPEAEPGMPYGTVKSLRVSTFAQRYGCVAAINGSPFNPSSDREGEKRSIVGIGVEKGRWISPAVSKYAALVFHPDKTAAVISQASIPLGSAIQNALGGFFVVLSQGKPQGTTVIRNPRSAAGLGNGGKTLYLVAIDGRRGASVGTTSFETGKILSLLGAQDGLIFDGGGSTALVLRQQDGSYRPLNVPIHDGKPFQERAVALSLGIRLTEIGE
jgi:hypothetical protein